MQSISNKGYDDAELVVSAPTAKQHGEFSHNIVVCVVAFLCGRCNGLRTMRYKYKVQVREDFVLYPSFHSKLEAKHPRPLSTPKPRPQPEISN